MLNKAILMGRLTRDPEVRTTTSGVSVARFSLAIDRRFQRQGEERQTDFINIVCFNRTADFVKQYFVKGQMMCVVGSIQTRSWEGQDGRKNYAAARRRLLCPAPTPPVTTMRLLRIQTMALCPSMMMKACRSNKYRGGLLQWLIWIDPSEAEGREGKFASSVLTKCSTSIIKMSPS